MAIYKTTNMHEGVHEHVQIQLHNYVYRWFLLEHF